MPTDEEHERAPPFIRNIVLDHERIQTSDAYPFSLPAIHALDGLAFSTVTYFVGENGAGKSTILEALAIAAGFNAEGGSANMRFATRPSESPLHRCLRLARTRRPRTGFFLRAESFFNVATEIERLGAGEFSPCSSKQGVARVQCCNNVCSGRSPNFSSCPPPPLPPKGSGTRECMDRCIRNPH